MEKIKEFIQQCGAAKIVVLIGCGILLLLLSCNEKEKEKNEGEEERIEQVQGDTSSTEEYRKQMEERIISILSQAEGVGNVEVMLTLKTSREKVTLKDYTVETGKREEESVLLEGNENQDEPYVVQEKEPEVEGILVVCSHGDNPGVQREIIDGISALFPVDSHKIKVMKRKEVR